MITELEFIELVEETFVAAWGTTTPITLDNEPFKEPTTPIPWVRLSVKHMTSRQETLGAAPNRKFERKGKIFVQVFEPVNKGRKVGATLAQQVRNIFEATSSGEAYFLAGNTREIGPDGKWFQTNVEIDFVYYENK